MLHQTDANNSRFRIPDSGFRNCGNQIPSGEIYEEGQQAGFIKAIANRLRRTCFADYQHLNPESGVRTRNPESASAIRNLAKLNLVGRETESPLLNGIFPGNAERIQQQSIRGGLHFPFHIRVLKKRMALFCPGDFAHLLEGINTGKSADFLAGLVGHRKTPKANRRAGI